MIHAKEIDDLEKGVAIAVNADSIVLLLVIEQL